MSDSLAHVILQGVSVGYNGITLIHDIDVEVKKGEILTLIGPNGAGKSTILKSLTRQLKLVAGQVLLDGNDMMRKSYKELATDMAVVLTDRVKPELMTCHDIVASGRYPYTGRLGVLTERDEQMVEEAMSLVHAKELGPLDFNRISDGQKQRILLARAICQEPKIIVLDEPTSYLDVRYKIELLSILKRMAKEKQITIIMSLHEIELARLISDQILCVKGERIAFHGAAKEVFKEEVIRNLYEIKEGGYDPCFDSYVKMISEGR